MSRHAIRLLVPEGQNYSCHSCAQCCHGAYAIGVTDEEQARIEAQGWDEDPELQGRPLFAPLRIGGQTVLAHDEDGACVFLQSDGRCRIHGKYGLEAKPLSCQMYPYVPIPVGNEVRVSIQFDCPSVAHNRGTPLRQQLQDLRRLASLSLPPDAHQPPPPLDSRRQLSWPQLLRIIDALCGIVGRESLELTRRMIACATFTFLLDRVNASRLEGRGLREFCQLATEAALKDAEADPLERQRPPRRIRILFRQALGFYSRHDRLRDLGVRGFQAGGRLKGRLGQSLRLIRGTGSFPRTQPDFPTVPIAAMEPSLGLPEGACAEMLTRYYCVRLWSTSFCGRPHHNMGFIEGLKALWVTYPVMMWFIRFHALGFGNGDLTADSAEWAIRTVDRQYTRSTSFAVRTERWRHNILGGEDALRNLIIWYGS